MLAGVIVVVCLTVCLSVTRPYCGEVPVAYSGTQAGRHVSLDESVKYIISS